MDMSSTFRDYALKKLSEAREKGATIANATAATISNTVPVTLPTSSSFSFRSNTPKHESKQNEWTLEKKVVVLTKANAKLKKAANEHSIETLDNAVYKIDLINESLVYSIANIQECSRNLKSIQIQFSEICNTDDHPIDRQFYKQK